MSAGQRHSQLCIVPAVETTTDLGEPATAPMWHDAADLEARAGNVFPRSFFEDSFPGYLANNTGYDEFYVVRFYGTGSAAYQQLNSMATTWECLVLTNHQHNIGDVMAAYFSDDPRGPGEWQNVFTVEY
jgi:hypothetical protein